MKIIFTLLSLTLALMLFAQNKLLERGQMGLPTIEQKKRPETKNVNCSIRIRCVATIQEEPLIIIDGIVVDNKTLNIIDPNDIVSIYILKDAAATRIYGCRAAAGVILITTNGIIDAKLVIRDFTTGESLEKSNVELIDQKRIRRVVSNDSGTVNFRGIIRGKKYELNITHPGYDERVISYVRSSSGVDTIYLKKKIDMDVAVYPNPILNSGTLQLRFDAEMPPVKMLSISNAQGKLLLTQRNSESSKALSVRMDSKWNSGVYFIQMFGNDDRLLKTSQILIQ